VGVAPCHTALSIAQLWLGRLRGSLVWAFRSTDPGVLREESVGVLPPRLGKWWEGLPDHHSGVLRVRFPTPQDDVSRNLLHRLPEDYRVDRPDVYVQQCTQLTGTNSQALDRIDQLLAEKVVSG
jgi:hypothetical protein